jgi:hypothetical protein
MTKKEAALGVVAVAAAAALGYSLAVSSRVIIIKDGTVDLLTFGSDLTEENPPTGQGRKYKWSAKAKGVAVYDCNTLPPVPNSFGRVKIETVLANGTSATDLEVRNEGTVTKMKIQLAKTGFSIEGAAPGYRLKKGTNEDLHIIRVTVDNGTPKNFDKNENGTIDGDEIGDACVAFVEN